MAASVLPFVRGIDCSNYDFKVNAKIEISSVNYSSNLTYLSTVWNIFRNFPLCTFIGILPNV